MPQPAAMRFLKTLDLAVEKIETLDIADDRRLASLVRSFQFRGRQRPDQAMMRHHLVHPVEPLEMVPIELAGLRLAHHRECAVGSAAKNWSVRHIGEAGHRERT